MRFIICIKSLYWSCLFEPNRGIELRELLLDQQLVLDRHVRPRHHQRVNSVRHHPSAHQRQQQAVALVRDFVVAHDDLRRGLEIDLQVSNRIQHRRHKIGIRVVSIVALHYIHHVIAREVRQQTLDITLPLHIDIVVGLNATSDRDPLVNVQIRLREALHVSLHAVVQTVDHDRAQEVLRLDPHAQIVEVIHVRARHRQNSVRLLLIQPVFREAGVLQHLHFTPRIASLPSLYQYRQSSYLRSRARP